MRRYPFGTAALLLAVWLLAWGTVTWANVASGVLVAAAVVALVPDVGRPPHLPVVRPVPAARLAAHLVRDVLVSNLVLTREVLTRRSGIATGVVRVPLAGCSDELVTLMSTLVAMTPGTMPVEVEQDPTVLYVHVLHLDDPERVRRAIWRLRDEVVQAFGTAAAVAEVEQAKAQSRAHGAGEGR